MANAANPEQLKRQQLQQDLADRQAKSDFLWLMDDPRGRRFIWQLMGRCRIFEPVFNTHGGLMNFNEGRRDVGLFLLGEINRLCPEKFAVAAAENAKPLEDEETNDD